MFTDISDEFTREVCAHLMLPAPETTPRPDPIPPMLRAALQVAESHEIPMRAAFAIRSAFCAPRGHATARTAELHLELFAGIRAIVYAHQRDDEQALSLAIAVVDALRVPSIATAPAAA